MNLVFVVVDDHEIVQKFTSMILKEHYPESQIFVASNAQEAKETIRKCSPDLVICDLSIPITESCKSGTESGLLLLSQLLENYPHLNILVQSAYSKALIRIRDSIDKHQAGFVVVDKSRSSDEFKKKVGWAIDGLIYTPPDMRNVLTVRPEWLRMLSLAFNKGLQDKAIAEEMNISERTVRNYWTRLQDSLEVYPKNGYSIRIRTELAAREKGLLE